MTFHNTYLQFSSFLEEHWMMDALHTAEPNVGTQV